jgi:hypothetical protein
MSATDVFIAYGLLSYCWIAVTVWREAKKQPELRSYYQVNVARTLLLAATLAGGVWFHLPPAILLVGVGTYLVLGIVMRMLLGQASRESSGNIQ